jgi:hypothetical protein
VVEAALKEVTEAMEAGGGASVESCLQVRTPYPLFIYGDWPAFYYLFTVRDIPQNDLMIISIVILCTVLYVWPRLPLFSIVAPLIISIEST